jgi:beta-carotene 3-hydroxylase
MGPVKPCRMTSVPEAPILAAMHWTIGLLLFVATILAMEAVAYGAHRWIMHGPGWFLHASHHRVRTGRYEANDLYAVIFAVPSIALIFGGVNLAWGSWAIWVGAGIAAYGAIYFGFHDVIVHKRIAHRYVGRSRYMKRIIQAHRLHHAVESREGAVSFGFLWAPPADSLKAELKRRAREGVRAGSLRPPATGDSSPASHR